MSNAIFTLIWGIQLFKLRSIQTVTFWVIWHEPEEQVVLSKFFSGNLLVMVFIYHVEHDLGCAYIKVADFHHDSGA